MEPSKKLSKKALKKQVKFLESKVARLESTIKWEESKYRLLEREIEGRVSERTKDRLEEYERMHEALGRQFMTRLKIAREEYESFIKTLLESLSDNDYPDY